MRKIRLNTNQYALVDDEDYAHLNQWKWQVDMNGYAIRRHHVKMQNGKQIRRMMRMHREVNKTPDGKITDHINGDRLDNRKSNLRTADKSQNSFNSGMPKNNRSGFKGVFWSTQSNKWQARITIGRKQIHLGFFTSPIKASEAREAYAKSNFGEFYHG